LLFSGSSFQQEFRIAQDFLLDVKRQLFNEPSKGCHFFSSKYRMPELLIFIPIARRQMIRYLTCLLRSQTISSSSVARWPLPAGQTEGEPPVVLFAYDLLIIDLESKILS
jgi:hypothetical protein